MEKQTLIPTKYMHNDKVLDITFVIDAIEIKTKKNLLIANSNVHRTWQQLIYKIITT